MPSVPIAGIFGGQLLLIVAVFVALITVFAVQMDTQTEKLATERLRAQLANVRSTIHEPYAAGVTAAENLYKAAVADPAAWMLTDEASLTKDINFLRLAGIQVRTTENIMYISQFKEPLYAHPSMIAAHDNVPLMPDGKPYLTRSFTNAGQDIKTYGGNFSFAFKSPAVVSEAEFKSQFIMKLPNFPQEIDPIYDNRLNDSDPSHARFWTHYPYASAEGFIRAAVYSVIIPNSVTNALVGLPLDTPGVRHHNKWMIAALVNLSSITRIMRGLTDGEDSFASLYDVNLNNGRRQLIATTDASIAIERRNPLASGGYDFQDADKSSSPRMNQWFTECYQHLTEHVGVGGDDFDVIRADQRLLSFTTVRLGDALQLFAIVSTPESRYFSEAIDVRNTMIAVGVVCAVVVIIVCILILLAIRLPLAKVCQNMGLASVLKNEDVVKTSSVLTDIQVICVAFDKMNAMLMAAKAFLPASLISKFSMTDSDSDDEDEDDDEHDDHDDDDLDDDATLVDDHDDGDSYSRSFRTTSSTAKYSPTTRLTDSTLRKVDTMKTSKNGNTKTKKKNNRRSVGDVHSGSLAVTNSSTNNPAAGKRPHSNGGLAHSILTSGSGGGGTSGIDAAALLKNRRVAVLCVNVRGFTLMHDYAINTITRHSSVLMDLLVAAASTEKGVIDSFHGDHFVLSFNAVKTAASPARKAVACAFKVTAALANTPYKSVSMGAACSNALVGPLGNSTQRRMSIVGSCYTKALRLQTASNHLERSVDTLFGLPRVSKFTPPNCFNCLIDAAIYNECRDACATMLVGCFTSPPQQKSTAGSGGVGASANTPVGIGGGGGISIGARVGVDANTLAGGGAAVSVNSRSGTRKIVGGGSFSTTPVAGTTPAVGNGVSFHLMMAAGIDSSSPIVFHHQQSPHRSSSSAAILKQNSEVVPNAATMKNEADNDASDNNNSSSRHVASRTAVGAAGRFSSVVQPFAPSDDFGNNTRQNINAEQSISGLAADSNINSPSPPMAYNNASADFLPAVVPDNSNRMATAMNAVSAAAAVTSRNNGPLADFDLTHTGAPAVAESPLTLMNSNNVRSRQASFSGNTNHQNNNYSNNGNARDPSGIITSVASGGAAPAASAYIYATLSFEHGAAGQAAVAAEPSPNNSNGVKKLALANSQKRKTDDEAAEEWMYEMEKKTERQPFKEVATAFECALHGDFDGVSAAMEARCSGGGINSVKKNEGNDLAASSSTISMSSTVAFGSSKDQCLAAVLNCCRKQLSALLATTQAQQMEPASRVVSEQNVCAFSFANGGGHNNLNASSNIPVGVPAITARANSKCNVTANPSTAAVANSDNFNCTNLTHPSCSNSVMVLRSNSLRINFPDSILSPVVQYLNNPRVQSLAAAMSSSRDMLAASCGLSGLDGFEAAEVAAWLRLVGLIEVVGIDNAQGFVDAVTLV